MNKLALTLPAVALAASLGVASAAPGVAAKHDRDDALVSTFADVTRSTAWTKTATIDLEFDTYHPQAMEVAGNYMAISSVQIDEAPVKYPAPVNGMDRTPGKGKGHLFITDRAGNLLKDVTFGEGDIYHPGGLDFDGRYIWMPVAEYRPDSRAIIYRIDTQTWEVKEIMRVADHIGGVILDQKRNLLVGQSWGSRRFYEWTLDGRQVSKRMNPSHFVDYQDCEYVKTAKMLCTGITNLPPAPGSNKPYELGGAAMIDLRNGRILHEAPIQLWSTAGHVVTRNPVDIDARGRHLTMYAAPDDAGEGKGTQVLVYEADVQPLR